jgi:PAS domain S-box-containing protein
LTAKDTEPESTELSTVRVPEKLAPLFRQAQRYVRRYFADQRSVPERGTLEISGQRYMLIRAASMSVEFHDMVKSFYAEEGEASAVAHALLFDVAHAMGLADAKAFGERMNVHDPIARLSAGPVHFAHAGWAFVEISGESSPSANEEFYLLYDHPYSFESDSWLAAHKATTSTVCMMNAGYSSGWCEDSFGVRLVAVEILCRARGDSACRFIMAPPERIEGHVARYAADHPELAPRIASYQVPGFFGKHRVERERERAALQASQEFNERLIQALPGGIVHVTRDGAIVRANAEASRILGLTHDELSKSYTSDFATVTLFEDGSPAAVADYPVTKALTTGEMQPATTLGIRKPSGEVSWAVFRAVPTRDVAGNIDGAVVTFLDITERKRFEEKLRQTQKLESLGVLAGGIAHDFNNLLVAILGNASLGRNVADADPRLAPLFEEIELAARRAAELTKHMLDYAGHGRSLPESVDLSAIVREMVKLLKAVIPAHAEIHYQLQEGVPALAADPAQLRQVVMNLITNASEAMAERPGRILIAVEHRRFSREELEAFVGDPLPGSFVVLEVSDAGIGMGEETRARIFDPFFTTKFKGRGLGMATVLGIVRGHRGGIRVESREGVGTRSVVLFPARSERGSRIPVAAGGASGTVLVVDDNEPVRTLVHRTLGLRGYRTIQAADGAEGVRLFEQHQAEITLVLMDVDMPGMNGFEAADRIVALCPGTPVLMSSGYQVDPGELERRGLGLLEKPYDTESLLAALEGALAGRARA